MFVAWGNVTILPVVGQSGTENCERLKAQTEEPCGDTYVEAGLVLTPPPRTSPTLLVSQGRRGQRPRVLTTCPAPHRKNQIPVREVALRSVVKTGPRGSIIQENIFSLHSLWSDYLPPRRRGFIQLRSRLSLERAPHTSPLSTRR